MTRRRRRQRAVLDGELARAIGALALLGLLYLGFKIGLLAWIANIPIDILQDGLPKVM